VIGLHNYSFTTFAANREKAVIVNSTELAGRLETVFDKDWRVSVS
jgi:phosphatidylserine/phosphatidylglycerophosphate/cardiolipin synthase-like enzyme